MTHGLVSKHGKPEKNELLLTGWCGMCLVCLRLMSWQPGRMVHDTQHLESLHRGPNTMYTQSPAMQPTKTRLKVEIGVEVEAKVQVIARGRR